MTHHPRMVVMTFYDVPNDSLEMVHQLFQHLSEVTQGSCNYNVIDPRNSDEVLLPVELDGQYVGEASIDVDGDISMSFGRGQRGLELRHLVEVDHVHVLNIVPGNRR